MTLRIEALGSLIVTTGGAAIIGNALAGPVGGILLAMAWLAFLASKRFNIA